MASISDSTVAEMSDRKLGDIVTESMSGKIGIALLGTGYVADFYMQTLVNYPYLDLRGVHDRSAKQQERFCAHYRCKSYSSLEAMLEDPTVNIVVNLASPDSHYELSLKAMRAGKHVYCEKPFTLDLDRARELAETAARLGLTISAAPAVHRSSAWRLVSELLADDSIGNARLVYAAMEDGPVYREDWRLWRSASGAPWPGATEFEIGCTLEHSGYPLTWMVSLFGQVEELTSFTANVQPDKGLGSDRSLATPDLSIACLRFVSGVVARLTCGLTAEKDRSLLILGEHGSIYVSDMWDDRSPVYLERFGAGKRPLRRFAEWLEGVFGKFVQSKPRLGSRVRYRSRAVKTLPEYPSQIDFAAGIAHQAEALISGTDIDLQTRIVLHVTELSIALSNSAEGHAFLRPLTSI